MTGTMKTLAELFDETEAVAKARYDAEQAAEAARVAALTPEQREAEIEVVRKAYDEKCGHFDDAVEDDCDEEDDDD